MLAQSLEVVMMHDGSLLDENKAPHLILQFFSAVHAQLLSFGEHLRFALLGRF